MRIVKIIHKKPENQPAIPAQSAALARLRRVRALRASASARLRHACGRAAHASAGASR
jgi:hypothetical protein